MTRKSRRASGSGVEKLERKWGILLALPAILGFVLLNLGPMIFFFLYRFDRLACREPDRICWLSKLSRDAS